MNSREQLFCLGLLATAAAAQSAESRDQLRVRLFEETKVVAVMGLPQGSRDYKGDGNPETLEIVFLEKKAEGPSRVSEDGQVIFLYKASDKAQSMLIEKAFELRLAKVLNGA